ncbi:uncharacterized protein EI90DRAFT_3085539 [Cantharellus anzutake]|uniref:uncharacterized protein n=1 Tax=Cantharellus anzutake TaxID=1750568 RepID=UPI0019052E87|nr:uncharacterized protein EI90DRAFT_3085539 [Cantharellus anzutake]KAF8316976.1 hypothetical protein EI90DRAFT_3085539 [Cantharellus anzutake]
MQAKSSFFLGEPLALSTFALPSASKAGYSSHVLGSYTNVPRNEDGWLTLTCQGDGVHIVDLSTNRRFASFTLGPSTTFACPSITTVVEDQGMLSRTTYAVVETSPNIDSDGRGRTIWMWQETHSGKSPNLSAPKRIDATVEHRICSMHYVQSSNLFILFSDENEILTVDSGFKRLYATKLEIEDSYAVLQRWVLHDVTFITSPDAMQNSIIAQAMHNPDGQPLLLLYSCGPDGSLTFLEKLPIDTNAKELAYCTLSQSGDFSVLSRQGQWYHYRLRLAHDSWSLTQSSTPFRLKSLTLFGSTSASSPTTLLSLTASHVFLASVSSTSELVLQIWDLKYSLLMSIATAPISGLSGEWRLRLIGASKSQVFLTVSPPLDETSKPAVKARRSTVFSVPYAVPPFSTIANAICQSQKVDQAPWAYSNSTVTPTSPEASAQKAVATNLRHVMPTAYGPSSWALIQEQSEARHRDFVDKFTLALNDENYSGAAAAFTSWEKDDAGTGDEVEGSHKEKMPYQFAATFIKAILSLPRINKKLWTVTQTLLSSRSVFNNMLPSEGGIFRRLMELEEWTFVLRSLEVLPDIPEDELARGLKTVVDLTLKVQSKRITAVGPDEGEATEPNLTLHTLLPSYLARMIAYPYAPALLRTAFRKHVNDPKHLVHILPMLSQWARTYLKQDDVVFLKPQPTALIFYPSSPEANTPPMPSFETLLLFLENFLDSSFVSLVQYEAAHSHLVDIANSIRLTTKLFVELDTLKGPLEPFSETGSYRIDNLPQTTARYTVQRIVL